MAKSLTWETRVSHQPQPGIFVGRSAGSSSSSSCQRSNRSSVQKTPSVQQ